MPLTFTSTAAGTSADYIRYLGERPVKTDTKNQPSTLAFSFIPIDGSFVKLVRGNYIKFDTATYPNWFTGYITSDPELTYIGTNSSHQPVFGYKYTAVSDEYILSLKPLGIVPPFVNTNMGTIIQSLAEMLVPGAFTYAGVQAGIRVARYVPDPQAKFSDVVKSFCDSAQYRFRANNHTLVFQPQDTTPCGTTIDGNSKHFTPSRLTLTPSTDPIINDAVVFGDIEPQDYVNEYFVGDGLTGAFPLLTSPFGVDRTIFLDEDFSSGSFDPTKWTVNDALNTKLAISTGYLNCLGGSNNGSYDVYLQSALLLPLEGAMRFTGGEFDFLNTGSGAVSGIVASLWSSATPVRTDDLTWPGCVYGLRVELTGRVYPIANGAVDTSQTFTINYTKRYVIRTLLNTRCIRYTPPCNYVSSTGVVTTKAGSTSANTATFTTLITEIDPSTGVTSNSYTFTNSFTLSTSVWYASYFPVISNDLHCTVTGITISTPIQVQLDITPKGGSLAQKLVGPNEIDALDGLAPVATVVDANNGITTRSSALGTPQYNPGNAILTFFKDTTKQTATTPQVGDAIHIAYRKAGAAVGRVRSGAAIGAESTLWTDNGVRSVMRADLDPKPRTSETCEVAAAAIVGDSSYQHYDGNYTQFSTYFTQEPLAGTILPFVNLPAAIPSVSAEELNQVTTTMVDGKPSELFEHQLTFGRPDVLSKFLAKFKKQTDVFSPDDTAETNTFIDTAQVGLAFASDVTAPSLVSITSSNLNFNTNQAAPTGGGFEVRLTNESWGADDAKNLVLRTSAQTFSVPRNQRGKTCFVKAYDARNKVFFSEDLTNAAWTKDGSSVTIGTAINPDGRKSQINVLTLTSGNKRAWQLTGVNPASAQVCASVSLKGTAGQTAQLVIGNNVGQTFTTLVTFTGLWQRVSLAATFNSSAGNLFFQIGSTTGTATSFSVTRASAEIATLVETVYCQTMSTAYGVTSRFPAALRVNYPLVPPAPTGLVDGTDYRAPIIRATLPALLQDVWGLEIRASDNTTVLSHKDLIDPNFSTTFTANNVGGTLNLSYYIYMYNLLGEYST